VKDHAGQKQIAIKQRIVRGNAIRQSQQAHNMLEKTAQPRVMKLPCCRRLAISAAIA